MRAPARLPRQNEMRTCWNMLPLPPVWNLIGRLQAMLLAVAIRISRLDQNWGSLTEFTVARAGIKGVARRSLSVWRGSPPTHLERRSAPAGLPDRTYARINLNEVRNENLIPRQRCSGASGRRKPRAGDRAGAETAR